MGSDFKKSNRLNPPAGGKMSRLLIASTKVEAINKLRKSYLLEFPEFIDKF